MIFSIVYNLLLAVLQLWFVLTVPEDFKLFTLVGICKTFGSGLQTAFFELQMPTCTSVSISHGGDKVLQTCERYSPAEKFDMFYRSRIEAVHHLGETRTRQELHLCWKQLKVSCHNNRDMCSLLTMSVML